jgi:hypothetical protein
MVEQVQILTNNVKQLAETLSSQQEDLKTGQKEILRELRQLRPH